MQLRVGRLAFACPFRRKAAVQRESAYCREKRSKDLCSGARALAGASSDADFQVFVRKIRVLLEHHPTKRDHPSDKDARQNKELERFPSCLTESIRSENALAVILKSRIKRHAAIDKKRRTEKVISFV